MLFGARDSLANFKLFNMYVTPVIWIRPDPEVRPGNNLNKSRYTVKINR